MVHIVFAPNFKRDVDLRPELAANPDIPENIGQFWPALSLVALSQQPHIDEGVGALYVPAELLNVAPNIQAFWFALRPIMMQLIDLHTRRQTRQSVWQGPRRADPHIPIWLLDA